MGNKSLPPTDKLSAQIDEAAQQCVKCGLCLPHCPTYQVARNENESPRGRIALAQGAVRNQVPITQKLLYHLDTCLACRACEAVCPAHVPYEELITSTRAWLHYKKLQKPIWLERLLLWIVEYPWLRNIFSKLAERFPKYKLQATSTKIINPIMQNPQMAIKGHVLLLPSCGNLLFDQQLAKDAQYVLAQLGWKVTIPSPTYCCGALALHAGKLTEAQQCAEQQINQWQNIKPDYIVSLTNGCHAVMQDYTRFPLNKETPKIPLLTIEAFLLQALNANDIKLQTKPTRVIVHTPCTLRNAIRQPDITTQLLEKIAGITCIPLPANVSGCCGAAGSYFLRHADIAEQLVSPIVKFIKENPAEAFITTNIGCAMHIQAALKKAKIDIPMQHPVHLIIKNMI